MEAKITPIAMALVVPDDADETLTDLFRAFELCRYRYHQAQDDEEPHICSADLGQIGFGEVRIRRTHQLLMDRHLLTSGPQTWQVDDGQQYGWDLIIYHGIDRFRYVQTLDEYLDELRSEINSLTGSPGSPPRVRRSNRFA